MARAYRLSALAFIIRSPQMRPYRFAGLSASLLLALSIAIPSPAPHAAEFDELTEIAKLEALKKQIAEDRRATAEANNKVAKAEATDPAALDAAIAASKSQEATSEATSEIARLKAYKDVFGDTKGADIDGSITINADTNTVMLQSRQGGILAVREAASELCEALKNNRALMEATTAQGKQIVPISEARLAQIVAAKLRSLQFDALYQAILAVSAPDGLAGREETPPPEKPGKSLEELIRETVPYSLPGAIAGLQQIGGLASELDKVAGAFRTTKTFTLDTPTTARADLFESRLGACSGVIDSHSLTRLGDRERLSGALAEHFKKLQVMQAFVVTVAAERQRFNALSQRKQTDALNRQISLKEALAAKVSGVSGTDEALAQDLALAAMERVFAAQPLMTYSLAIQDIQIKKDRFLLGDKLTFQGTAEVVYQITDPRGVILDGDAISVTSKAYDTASTFSVNALSNAD
ncbi:hypothetical protein QX25_18850 (plasmid) [Stutzerimonas stutzeri]|nr:hypothetical protein QX25_18850 [Stutzerimonas stutzeri]